MEAIHYIPEAEGQMPYLIANSEAQALLIAAMEADAPVGFSYGAMPVRDAMKENLAQAHRFLLMLVLMLLPVGLAMSSFGLHLTGEVGRQILDSPQSTLPLGVLFYGALLYAYLVGKTAQGCGASFCSNFLLSLVLPLAPAAWARIGRRKVWPAYLWLLIEGLLLATTLRLLDGHPLLFLALLGLLVPLVAYQLLGCAIGPVANAMGLYPALTILWLCLGPLLLIAIAVWEYFLTQNVQWTLKTFNYTLIDMKVLLDAPLLLSFPIFKTSVLIYLLTTVIVWIKTTYEILKLPLI